MIKPNYQLDLARFDTKGWTVGPGGWRVAPHLAAVFDWKQTVARPRQSPGLVCWVSLAQAPGSGRVLLSFAEITGGDLRSAPRYDFSGCRRCTRFLISDDQGETWSELSEVPLPDDPEVWNLNGEWGHNLFLSDNVVIGFPRLHTQRGRRPLVFVTRSYDGGKTWGPRHSLLTDPRLGCFGGSVLRLLDGRMVYFAELSDATRTSRCRIKLEPEVWIDQATPAGAIGVWISADGLKWPTSPQVVVDLRCRLNAGDPFEPDGVELENGDLLVVVRRHRKAAMGGEGLPWAQVRLRREVDGFAAGVFEECRASPPLVATGHPCVIRTDDGIILGVRSEGLWASVDEGGFWEQVFHGDFGYYPHGVVLDNGSILVAGHVGSDEPWPPRRDMSIILNRLRLERRPALYNWSPSPSTDYLLFGETDWGDVSIEAQLATEGCGGLLIRGDDREGLLSGYLFYVTARKPAWLLGRLESGRFDEITSAVLPENRWDNGRRLTLAAYGSTLRAFVNGVCVASGRDTIFARGRVGVIAQDGRIRVDSLEVRHVDSLDKIGGENVCVHRDLGAISYEVAADHWQAI